MSSNTGVSTVKSLSQQHHKQKQHSDQLPLLSTTTNAATAVSRNQNKPSSSFAHAVGTSLTIARGSDHDHEEDDPNRYDDDTNTPTDMGQDDNSDTEALPSKRGMRQRRSTSGSLEALAQIVHFIQRWKLPRSWLMLRKKTTTPTTSTTSSTLLSDDANVSPAITDIDHDMMMIPFISGLDRVVFGTASASEAVLLCGLKPPQYLWYMLSGGICDVIQFVLDVALHYTFGIEDASLCWALGFGLSIVFRHTSHRYLVFGDYVGGYQKSLIRMYGGYSIIIVISTIFNLVMTRLAKISHYAAWIITLLWTGIVNYFILKKLWSFGGKTTGVSTTLAASVAAVRGRTFSSGSTAGTTPVRGRTFSTGSSTTPQDRTYSSSANLTDANMKNEVAASNSISSTKEV